MLDYQKRMLDEKEALDMKISSLGTFTKSDMFDSITIKERRLMLNQLAMMSQYSSILTERITAF